MITTKTLFLFLSSIHRFNSFFLLPLGIAHGALCLLVKHCTAELHFSPGFYFVFWHKGSLCQGWPWTLCIAQADFQLAILLTNWDDWPLSPGPLALYTFMAVRFVVWPATVKTADFSSFSVSQERAVCTPLLVPLMYCFYSFLMAWRTSTFSLKRSRMWLSFGNAKLPLPLGGR